MHLQKYKTPFVSIIPHRSGAQFVSTTHDHVEAFQSLVRYIVKLRRDGDISNDTFEELVRQATAIFVETEISDRIDRVLENKISLDRLLELL